MSAKGRSIDGCTNGLSFLPALILVTAGPLVAAILSAAAASGFFSITAVVQYSLEAFTGRFADRFGPRRVVTVGAVALGLGLGLAALAGHIWFGYLTYGVGVGIGAACCYVPTLAVIGGWFVRRRNTALGVAAAGTGCGTMALPPLAAVLIQHYGWRATNIIFGLAAAVVLLGCAVVVKSPPTAPSTSAAGYSLKHVFRSHEFVLLCLSWVLATTALFVPFVFLPTFARDHGLSEVAAAGLVSVIGGASIIGRLALGPVGDRRLQGYRPGNSGAPRKRWRSGGGQLCHKR